MKYRLTPFNFLSSCLIVFAIFCAINPGSWGYGLIAAVFLFSIGFVGFLIDGAIQSFSFRFKSILLCQSVVFFLLMFSYILTQRSKTLIIPNNISDGYVMMIYDIKDAPELPKTFFSYNYKVVIPTNGIFLTSSKFNDDFSETEMINQDGKILNSKETEMGFSKDIKRSFICKGQEFKYRLWIVSSSCCGYSTKELDSLDKWLSTKYCD